MCSNLKGRIIRNGMIEMNDRYFYENVINSLRLGIVPCRYVEALTVGRTEIIKNIKSGIADIACGRASSMIFEGDYGAGKSHILNFAKYLAREKNFVISAISADQTLLFNKMDRVMNAIIEAMEFPDFGSFNGFEQMLNRLLNSWRRNSILDWCEDICFASEAEIKFKKGVKAYYIMMKGMNYEAAEDVRRWLQGEKVDLKRIKSLIDNFLNENKKTASFRIGQNEIIYLIQSIGQMLKAIGYSGWMIMVDECENFFELSPPNPKSKHKIFSNVDNMIRGFRNIFSIFTFTPRQLDRIHSYFVAQNSYDSELTIPNFLLPHERHKKIYRLNKLNDDNYIALLKKIVDAYEIAYPEKKLSMNYGKYLENKITTMASFDKERPRAVIRMIIEYLDYFLTNEIDIDMSLVPVNKKKYTEASSVGKSIQLPYVRGEKIGHKKYGKCEVLEVKKLPNDSVNIKVKVIKTGEIKIFDHKFAEFEKIKK